MDTVIRVTFTEPTQAHDAMAELHRLAGSGDLKVREASVVVHGEDGQWSISEHEEHTPVSSFTGSIAGGVLGTLVGALAGPIGILLGGASGALLGSVADHDNASDAGIVSGGLQQQVPPGTTGIVADIDEDDTAALDRAMAAHGGQVSRMGRAEFIGAVEAETEARHEERS